MNFFKRATISILRRLGKTIILLLLVFILGSVIAGAISVNGAINNANANLRRNMQPLVSIAFDGDAWTEYRESYGNDWITEFTQQPSPITPAHVRAIGSLPYVDFYDYAMSNTLMSFKLDYYIPEYIDFPEREEGMPLHVQVRGTNRTSLIQIEQEIINLVPGGRQFAEHELSPGAGRSVALVSEEFANTNNLSIGSTFELYYLTLFPDEYGDVFGLTAECFAEENIYARFGMEFEVIGLFEVPFDPEQADPMNHSRMNILNVVYVPNWVIEDMSRKQDAALLSVFEYSDIEKPWYIYYHVNRISVFPLFRLENPADIEAFRVAAEPLLPEFFQRLEDFSMTFDAIASSMETMQTIADWVLYVSIGATLLILSLLIVLFLRDRRYEMGVYLALGEKKRKIISQILLEVVVTSVIGLTLAVFVGNFVSDMVSQNMLRNELVAQAEAEDDPFESGLNWHIFEEIGVPTNNDLSVDEMMDAFEISLNIETVGLFYAVGLGVVVLSTMLSVLYIVKLSPKKVLM